MRANRADDWFAEGWKERRKDDGRNKVAEEGMYLILSTYCLEERG
jgi:hypothetical protein